MALFRKKQKNQQRAVAAAATPSVAPAAKIDVPEVDTYIGDREAEQVCAALRSGSWAEAQALLDTRDNGFIGFPVG